MLPRDLVIALRERPDIDIHAVTAAALWAAVRDERASQTVLTLAERNRYLEERLRMIARLTERHCV